ncbi:hypothetical protein BaRGS_00035596, partial [Batillaria attramentaria]
MLTHWGRNYDYRPFPGTTCHSGGIDRKGVPKGPQAEMPVPPCARRTNLPRHVVKILNGDAITIFKKFPLNTGSNEYVFSGSWKGRGAVYDASTTADVILPGSNLSRNDAGLYRCEVTTDRETIHDDVAVEVL